MATLEKIRTRAGVFITVIIGIALLSFLVNPQDIVQYFQSSKNTVGEINGNSINYQKFQKEVDYYTQIATIQANGQAPQGDEANDRINNQAWNKLLREYYLNDELKKVGLGISEKELGDLAAGTNLSPVMKSFADFVNPTTGQVNRENIQLFWQNPNNNPQVQQLISYLEDEIENLAYITKYEALVNKASYINTLEKKRAIANAANSVEFSYIVQRYMGGAEADSLYRIKESEAKDYYNKYKKRWEQQESRDIEMVTIPIIPTQEDYDATTANIQKLIPEFAASANLQQFVQFNSDNRQFDYAYHKQGELSAELNDFAFSASGTDVFGPYLDGSSYKIARVEDSRMIPDSVFIKEILIPVATQEDLNVADSITKLLQGGASWTETALKYSGSQQLMTNAGEVGWVACNMLPYPLSDSCFLNPTGKVMSMPTQEGMYIFQVSQKSNESRMARLAVVQKDVIPSKKTDEIAYGKANQLASLSQGGYEAFRKAVEENGYTAQPATNIIPGSKQILSIQNASPIVKWLYEDGVEKNSLSPVINVNQAYYVVAVVTETRTNGIAPFEQVKYSIGEELKKEKQAEAFTAKIKEAAATSGTIEDLAAKLNLEVLQVTSPVTFGSVYSFNSYIPGLGVEPKVTAAATAISELNKLSAPVTGSAGVYVLSLTNKRTDEGYTESMAKQSIAQGFAMKQMEWYNVLIKAGKVTDLRAKFF